MKHAALKLATMVMCASVTALAENKDAVKPSAPAPVGDRKPVMVAPEPMRRPMGPFSQMAKVAGLSDEQQKKLVDIQEAREKAMQELNNKFQKEIADVFTSEQKAKWNESMVMDMMKREFSKIMLSDDQNAKIKAKIAAETKDQLLGGGPQSWQTLRSIVTAVRNDILTEEQKAALKAGPEKKAPPKVEEKKPEAQPAVKEPKK